MLINVKELRAKVRALQKQISKEAIGMIDKNMDEYLNQLLARQKAKRLTGKNLEL